MNKLKLIIIVASVYLIQLLSFVLAVEFGIKYGGLLEVTWLLFPVIILFLYFYKKESIKKRLNLTNVAFYVSVIATWTLLNVISLFSLTSLLRIGFLHGQGGFLPGIEYVLIPFFYEILLAAILLLDLIWYFIKKYLKQKN